MTALDIGRDIALESGGYGQWQGGGETTAAKMAFKRAAAASGEAGPPANVDV